ncbi:MAG: methionine--tRNA ligase subunit beta, partial [Planctomycetota bacterium]
VWFDALINYISGIGYGEKDKLKFWPADYHVLGRDIVRFHCVIWPAMLMSAGLELPRSLFIHGFFTINGLKISKSLGNAIDPIPIAEKFGLDAFRYYLFSDFTFGQDGDFSFQSLANRINTELADDLGNLLSRTVAMTEKFLGGTLSKGEWKEEEDGHLVQQARHIQENLDGWFSRLEYSKLLGEIWKLLRMANKYAEDQKPWKLAKDEEKRSRLQQVLWNMGEVLRFSSYAFRPVMEETSQKILDQLGLKMEKDFSKALQWGRLGEKTKVSKKGSLFPKIEINEDDPFFSLGKPKEEESPSKEKSDGKQKKVEKSTKETKEKKEKKKEAKETITFEDFAKLDLRVAKVIHCEKVKKAKKLLRLEVELDGEKRQIVSGIALDYKPEELVGKSIILLANLEPRKIMGIESQGMLLAAWDGKKVVVLVPEKEVPPGTPVS